jgi:hypothetical protein
MSPTDLVSSLTGEQTVVLNIPDLDRGFRLTARSMVAVSTPLMYEQFLRNIDVAAIRRAGLGSVVTFIDIERAGGPLAVGAPLRLAVETRHVELSGLGLGQRAARVGFECRYTFASPPGVGDPLRYRETVRDTPEPCGRVRLLLTLVRMAGPTGRRTVAAPIDETRHLAVHVLDTPHPSVLTLSEVSEGYAHLAAPEAGADGVFGLQHTDTNQYVYTGEYLALLEDGMTRLAAAAGLPVREHSIERIRAVFTRPYGAGDRYVVRGQLWRHGNRTLALVGLYDTDGGSEARPAVFGRLDGALARG